jgi:hypothetical protein
MVAFVLWHARFKLTIALVERLASSKAAKGAPQEVLVNCQLARD